MKDILLAVTIIVVSSAVWTGSVIMDRGIAADCAALKSEVSQLRRCLEFSNSELLDAERRIAKMERLLSSRFEERATTPIISFPGCVQPDSLPSIELCNEGVK